MKFVIPMLVILVLLVIVGYRIHKQRNLIKKGEDYEKILREAKLTRYQYMQALHKTRDALTEVEGIEEKLTSLKAEIIGYHGDLREKIEHLRHQRKQSTGSDLDNRTLAQMKNDLTQLWAHTNSRKKVCREIEETHNELKRKHRLQESNEQKITDRWLTQRKQVMETYRELRDQLQLTDPKKSFS
jgi:hypothetical protein